MIGKHVDAFILLNLTLNFIFLTEKGRASLDKELPDFKNRPGRSIVVSVVKCWDLKDYLKHTEPEGCPLYS